MVLGVSRHSKGLRWIALRWALYVNGAVKNRGVGVNAGARAVRGGAVVGLGLFNPFAALIPLIAPSNNKPLPCAQLLADMRAAPSAPPAGQKQREKAAPAYLASGAAGPAEDSPGGSARTQAARKTAHSGPAASHGVRCRGLAARNGHA